MRVPAPKLGVQDCQSTVSESSDYAMFLHFFVSSQPMGAHWLSGRVFEPRLRGRGFEPHPCHCVMSLSKNINPSQVLVQPRKTRPLITERLLIGLTESNQTKLATHPLELKLLYFTFNNYNLG